MAKKKSNQLAHIKASLNKQSYNPNMLKRLIDFYLSKKSFNDAHKSLKNYGKEYSNDPIFYFLEGKILFSVNNIEQAKVKFIQAAALLEQLEYDKTLEKNIYCDIAHMYHTSAPHLAFYFYDKGAQLAPLSIEQKKSCTMLVDRFIRLIDHNWQLCFHNNQCVFSLASLKEEKLDIQHFENLADITAEQEYAFCQYFIKQYNELLDIAKTPEQYSTNIKLLQVDKLKDFYYKNPELWQAVCDKWCEKIYLIITDKKFNTLDINILKLPIIFKNYGWEIKNKQILLNTLKQLDLQAPKEKNIFEYDVYCIMHMLINMLYTTPFEATKEFNAQFLEQEKNYMQLAFYLPVLKILYDENYYNGLEKELIFSLQKIESTWKSSKNKYINTYCHSLNILFLLKFTIQSSRNWNKLIFENLISPLLTHYIAEKHFEVAHSLAICTDLSYGQQPITLEQHKLCWATYVNEIKLAAKSYADEISYIVPKKQASPTEVINIAFLIDFKFNLCSPIKVVFDVLSSLSLTHPNAFNITFYAFEGVENTIEVENFTLLLKELSFIKKINIVDFLSIRGCPINRDNFITRFSVLHKLITQKKIDILYYVHTSLYLVTFAAAFRLAPKQVLWSMGGGYNYNIPELDGYLTGAFMAPGRRTISGYQWDALPTIHLENLNTMPKDLMAANQLRKQKFSQYSTLIGCMTRASKLDNDDFLDTLEIILKRNPTTAFLWFHPKEIASLKLKMKQRGILKQCLYQGWVSTQVYAHLLDIHIESFPYPTGIVVTDAMLAETPCVFMHTPDNPLHLHSTIHDIISGKLEFSDKNKLIDIFSSQKTTDLFLYAYDKNEYIEHIQKLINNNGLRSDVGVAGKNFVQSFMHNPLIVGEEFAKYTKKIL